MYKYLVLASTSLRRINLLKKYVSNLVVLKPRADEVLLSDPYKTVYRNSRSKVYSVYDRAPDQSIIIGIDTVVYVSGYGVIGKPGDSRDAYRFLSKYSDRIHVVVSGVYLTDKPSNREYSFYTTSYVKFSKIDERDIKWYLSTNEWRGKAGGYAIQGYAGIFVEWILGDFYNVVGLPLNKLYMVLKNVYRYDLLRRINS